MSAVQPLVSILLINWNGREDTLACLDSLRLLRGARSEVIVVDNASTDGAADLIAAHYPEVHLLRETENLGFVGGNNAAIALARAHQAEYVLLLNNDTVVAPDFLSLMLAAMQADPQTGAAGPLIYYHAQPEVVWSAGGAIDWRRGSTRMLGLDEPDRGQFGGQPHPVDFVTGCALLVRMDVIDRVGVLDERFFAYYEETEWCVRMTRTGYRILFVPAAKVWHKISPTRRAASPMVHYYMTRNRLLFLRLAKVGWRPWVHTLVLEYARTLLSWTLRHGCSKTVLRNAMLGAVLDYFGGRFGKLTRVYPLGSARS